MSAFRVNVDSSAIAENYTVLRREVGNICCVVKCNAYGHGLENTVRALLDAGCDSFAVAAPEEAFCVRRIAPKAQILLLTYADDSEICELADGGVTLTLFSAEYAEIIKNAARKPRLHLKLDSGMNRSGFLPYEVPKDIFGLSGQIDGIYTHLPRAENIPESSNAVARFSESAAEMEALLGRSVQKHAAASLAALTIPQSRMDMSRIGLALYGAIPPADGASQIAEKIKLHPAMSVVSRVLSVRFVKKGEFVGYGEHFRAEQDMSVATVFGGYAHGIMRSCANRLQISICGQSARICGVPCMDRTMFDVTPILDSGTKVSPGDEAVIIGGERSISDFASACGTIPYEALLGMSVLPSFACRGENFGV